SWLWALGTPQGRVPAGCQLTMGTRSCVVKEDDDFLEHLVLLRTICLGADARDELHVVAVDSRNTYGDLKPVPIAALRSSVLPMVRISLKGLELVPPVTFMLECGAGPVYLSGQHVTREWQRDKVVLLSSRQPRETRPKASQNKQPLQ
uniref:Nucleoplasmin core domain-containing protein n=1 Tax=Otus sunia TaxID=257818 RepID=A0A8C8AC53_9STRI